MIQSSSGSCWIVSFPFGVEKENRFVLGGSAEELLNFTNIIKNMDESNKNTNFLIIVDENLEIVKIVGHHKTLRVHYALNKCVIYWRKKTNLVF